MSELIKPGDTFLWAPPGTKEDHLWIVLAVVETRFSHQAVMVNLTSARKGVDETTVLHPHEPGMHPFVRLPSCVLYRGIQLVDARSVPKTSRCERVTDELLDRLLKGAHASPWTGRRFKQMIPSR